MCIFAACVPCLAKYLFQSFAHLENEVIHFPTCGRSPRVWIRAPPLRVLAWGVSCGGSRAASGSRRSAAGFPGRPLVPGPAGPMSCGRSGRPTFDLRSSASLPSLFLPVCSALGRPCPWCSGRCGTGEGAGAAISRPCSVSRCPREPTIEGVIPKLKSLPSEDASFWF